MAQAKIDSTIESSVATIGGEATTREVLESTNDLAVEPAYDNTNGFAGVCYSSDGRHIEAIFDLEDAINDLGQLSAESEHDCAYSSRAAVVDIAERRFTDGNIRDIFVAVIAGIQDKWCPNGYDEPSDHEIVSNIATNPCAYDIARLILGAFARKYDKDLCATGGRPPLFGRACQYDAKPYANSNYYVREDKENDYKVCCDDIGNYPNLRLQQMLYSDQCGFSNSAEL